jgi:hypothetical protein
MNLRAFAKMKIMTNAGAENAELKRSRTRPCFMLESRRRVQSYHRIDRNFAAANQTNLDILAGTYPALKGFLSVWRPAMRESAFAFSPLLLVLYFSLFPGQLAGVVLWVSQFVR